MGNRTNNLEDKIDVTVKVIEKHEPDLLDLKKVLAVSLLWLEDFQNRYHWGNLRLQGIPGTVTDLTSIVMTLFQELVTAIPINQLEFDHIHKVLGPRRMKACDIII